MADFNGNPFWPILFRTIQTALETAPTLLCGLVLAGLLRGVIGAEVLRRWFTNDPKLGPLRACLIGFLLPVCSFGVLPVAWELRRAGIPRATVLTFLLSAPLANPISVTYALQKLGGQGTLAISVFVVLLSVALIILGSLGILLGRWLPESGAPARDLPPLPRDEFRRFIVAALTPARGITGTLSLFLTVGLLGSGLLALYPGGALEWAASDSTYFAPLHMGLAALPAQVPPEKGSTLLCDMLMSGVSFGVAFVFLTLGIGINVGTLVWIAWVYGARVAACLMPVLFATILAVGYALPFSLPGVPADAAQGRHFLEIESRGGPEIARKRAFEDTLTNDKGDLQWVEIGACAALGTLLFLGIICRVIGDVTSLHYQMTRPSNQTTSPPKSNWKRQLSGSQLALAGLVVGLVVVVAGMYVVYPSPGTLLDEMSSVQIELNLTLKSDPLSRPNALQLVSQWQRLQSKLVLGDFLRRGRFDSPLRQPDEELRLGIQKLRSALIEMKPAEELNPLYDDAKKAAARCRQAVGVK